MTPLTVVISSIKISILFDLVITRAIPGAYDPSVPRLDVDLSGTCQFPFIVDAAGVIGPQQRTAADPVSWRLKYRQVIEEFDDEFSLCTEFYHDPVYSVLPLLEERGRRIGVRLQTRCRKCDPCINYRRQLWGARGARECALSSRSWLCTFTLNAYNRFIYNLSEVGVDREITRSFQRFMKRLRKNKKMPRGALRYFAVRELHEDGQPHFHALLHESIVPVGERDIRACWRDGFAHAKLVSHGDPDAAYYVAKYVAKTRGSRVLSSKRYGRLFEDVNISDIHL